MITGTVSDQCAGAKAKVQSGEFSVVPAMSDESMGPWMQYVYMQKPIPTNAKGVLVKLTAIDPNGNFQDLGTAVTDTNGNYGIMWVPPVPGLYQIKATFAGSESYGGSTATTYIGVDPSKPNPVVTQSPSPTSPLTPIPSVPPVTTIPASPSPSIAPPPPTSDTPTMTYVAISIAAIIIIIAAAVLVTRRRK